MSHRGNSKPTSGEFKRGDVAALYIDPRGPYPSLLAEVYDEARDARTYAGSLPVVAHPPCGPWGGSRHLYRGAGKELAPHAVKMARRLGGVVEHPAGSMLWPTIELPLPGEGADEFGGFTLEVEQVRWGHVARKRTWLYCVRCTLKHVVPPPREPTHWVSGRRGHPRSYDNVPPGIKVCGAEQRRRTPIRFARFLIELAASSTRRA